MSEGPGKYNDLTDYVREQTKADGVVLVVIGGTRGSGFELQFSTHDSGDGRYLVMMEQVKLLRDVADRIQSDARRMRQKVRGN